MTGIDWSQCPICETDPEKMGGVYTVRAYRMAAEDVYGCFEERMTPKEIAWCYSLPLADVNDILAFGTQWLSLAKAS